MVLLLSALCRAGFEPLAWRCHHGPSLGRSLFHGRYHNPGSGPKPARIGVAREPNLGSAEFFTLPLPGSFWLLIIDSLMTSPRTLPRLRYGIPRPKLPRSDSRE
jgi:hypothetical protein